MQRKAWPIYRAFSMTDISKLKSCPFCGGEPIVERQGDRRQSHIIYCGECGGRLETGETWNTVQLWNTRTEPQVKPGTLERIIWSAMVWARENPGPSEIPEYTDEGNSHAENEARASARRILDALT